MTDDITRRRLDFKQFDHFLELTIGGVLIGSTGMIRWHLEQDGDQEYDEQYVADVLEKVIEVIRNNDANTSNINSGE